MGSTAKYALHYPDATDPNNVPADMQTLADGIDAIIATADQDVIANLPAAGKSGRWFYATDTGELAYDTGSAWLVVPQLDGTSADITSSSPGDMAAAGATGKAADAGHRHARESSAAALAGPAAITTLKETLVSLGSMGATAALDFSAANEFTGVLSANCTVSMTNVPATTNTRVKFRFRVAQNGTGGFGVTWPASFDWGDAGAPTIPTAANAAFTITGYTDNAGTNWRVRLEAVPGTATPSAVVIGGSGAAGTSVDIAHTDHTHPGPSLAAIGSYGESLLDLGNTGGGTVNIDMTSHNAFKAKLTGNCTFAMTNVPATSGVRLSFSLETLQDATGGRAPTWPASWDWGSAGAPVLSAANKRDFITGYSDDNGTTWRTFFAGAGGF